MFRHMFQSFLFFFQFQFFNDTIVCISDTQILDHDIFFLQQTWMHQKGHFGLGPGSRIKKMDGQR